MLIGVTRTKLAPNYPLKHLYAILLLTGLGLVLFVAAIFDSPAPLDREEYERSNHSSFTPIPSSIPVITILWVMN